MKHTQLVLVEFDNAGPWVTRFVSDEPITIERVAQHFIETEGFNEDCDSLTFVSEPDEIQLT